MAGPHVAAVAAMILSQYSALSNEQVSARLLGTTDEIVTQNPSESHLLGSGRLNAKRALSEAEQPAIVYVDHEIRDDDDGDGHLEPGERASLVVSLRNLWAPTTSAIVTLETTDQHVEILRAHAYYTALPTGDEVDNASNPLRIALDASASPTAVPDLTLTVNTSEGYARVLGMSLMRQIRLQAGDWPGPVVGSVEPIPYDIDGDGQLELLVNYLENGKMGVINPDGSVASTLGTGQERFQGIAAGDVNRDGHIEVVAVYGYSSDPVHYYLSLWGIDGKLVCPPRLLEHVHSRGRNPTLYDMDGDGDLEIIVAGVTHDRNHVAVGAFDYQDHTLELLWETIVDVPDVYYPTDVSVGDIDAAAPIAPRKDTAGPELIFATGTSNYNDGGHVFVLHSDGRVADRWPVSTEYGVGFALPLADLTGDGNLEIIVNTYNGGQPDGLVVWDYTGAVLWTGIGISKTPVVADLDGDGDLEVLTQKKAYHHDGCDTGWHYDVLNPNGATVGDIDGDGDMEVLLGASNSDGLVAFHYDGTPVPGFPLFVDRRHRLIFMTPVISDLDRDVDVEVVVGGEYLAAWDLFGAYDPGKVEWGMYQHDPYRTGNYHTEINFPPVWNVAPEDVTFVRTRESEFFVRAGDPERKSVSYQIQGPPGGAVFEPDGDGWNFSWQPSQGDVSQDVTFGVTDADGEHVEKTIHITLLEPSDWDQDGDTDLEDYFPFWVCLSGPEQPPPYVECSPADFDADGDIDLDDFAALQDTFSP
jgi:hypothetical protein